MIRTVIIIALFLSWGYPVVLCVMITQAISNAKDVFNNRRGKK